LYYQKNDYNSKKKDIIVAAIISNVTSREYSLLITTNDLEIGNLKVDSCIRVNKIYTLSQDIVIKKFGEGNDDIMHKVKNKINELVE